MNRAMFSGVAGLKTHQYKLDVIGNNVANVNTYGYKSQRAVFSDIYYQTLRGASAGNANRGGTNPSMIGYGSSLLGIQSQMTQSSMQNTGFGLDAAIAGEGYFQVMDADGNIFYTKAGMFSYDSEGYLVDINGNFVLGTQDAQNGDPDTQKIKLDNAGAVSAARPSFTTEIDGIRWTMTASNATAKGNVGVSIASSTALPIGQKAQAVISGGSISVLLNASEQFGGIEEVNQAINDAITEANGGKTHVAGTFTLSAEPVETGQAGVDWPLTGEQLANVSGGYDKGQIVIPGGSMWGGFKFKEVGNDFNPAPGEATTFTLTRVPADAAAGTEEKFEIIAKVGSIEYKNTILASQMNAPGEVMLKNGDSTTDTITLTYPSYTTVMTNASDKWQDDATWAPSAVGYSKTQFANGEVLGGLNIKSLPEGLDYPITITGFQYDRTNEEFKVTFTAKNTTVDPAVDATGISFSFKKNMLGKNDSPTLTGLPAGITGTTVSITGPSLDKLLGEATGGVTWEPVNINQGGSTAAGYDVNNILPSTPSKNVGLASKSFALTGGTEGGPITLDELTSINIGTDGTVSVYHPEKGLIEAGKISIATFANPNGLQQEGNNYFSESLNSGEAVLADPGTNGTGPLKTSSLEMSNVDLAEEFSHMITTQRGFQANSRIITVSDTMLEELINLKR